MENRSIAFSQVWRLRADDGDLVLFNINNDTLLVYNETAAKIILYLREGKGVKDIADILCNEYDVEHEDVKKDIENLLFELIT